MVHIPHSLDDSHGHRAIGAVFAMFVIGASYSPTPAASQPSPTPSPSPSPTALATPSGWPTGGPVPQELTGVWYAGASAITLFGNKYTIVQTGGNVVVNGNEIAFFKGNGCGIALPGGIGRYSWTLTSGSLHLVPVGPDPCLRSEVLADATLTRTRS